MRHLIYILLTIGLLSGCATTENKKSLDNMTTGELRQELHSLDMLYENQGIHNIDDWEAEDRFEFNKIMGHYMKR